MNEESSEEEEEDDVAAAAAPPPADEEEAPPADDESAASGEEEGPELFDIDDEFQEISTGTGRGWNSFLELFISLDAHLHNQPLTTGRRTSAWSAASYRSLCCCSAPDWSFTCAAVRARWNSCRRCPTVACCRAKCFRSEAPDRPDRPASPRRSGWPWASNSWNFRPLVAAPSPRVGTASTDPWPSRTATRVPSITNRISDRCVDIFFYSGGASVNKSLTLAANFVLFFGGRLMIYWWRDYRVDVTSNFDTDKSWLSS